MLFPWLITLRPWIIPTDAREQLSTFREILGEKTYLDRTWDVWNNGLGEGKDLKPHEGWPKPKTDEGQKVTPIKAGSRRGN